MDDHVKTIRAAEHDLDLAAYRVVGTMQALVDLAPANGLGGVALALCNNALAEYDAAKARYIARRALVAAATKGSTV
jgi:hypothetical protein